MINSHTAPLTYTSSSHPPPALPQQPPPPMTLPLLCECVGVSEGEAAAETGSGDQLVRTGVQTVCSRQTGLCTWLPTRDLTGETSSSFPLSFCFRPFFLPLLSMSVSLSLPISPSFLLPSLPLSQSIQRCVSAWIPLFSPQRPLLCLGWSVPVRHTNTQTDTHTHIYVHA